MPATRPVKLYNLILQNKGNGIRNFIEGFIGNASRFIVSPTLQIEGEKDRETERGKERVRGKPETGVGRPCTAAASSGLKRHRAKPRDAGCYDA